MAVRFILGRAGSGKTHWCQQRILQAMAEQPLGTPVYWIVPSQATFQTQRALACADGRDGFFPRILSFDDLSRSILDECGGSALPLVSSVGRWMILGHLLRQQEKNLRFFHTVTREPGVITQLDGAFAELERCGLDPTAIANEFADEDAPPSSALSAKLHDLRLLHRAYLDFIGQKRIDPAQRLAEALAAISRCPSLQGGEVYVDGFHDFDHYERQVMAGLAGACKSVAITLTLDPDDPCIANPNHNPDEMNLFHRTLQTYRKLHFALNELGVAMEQPLLLRQIHRFESSDLAAIETWDGEATAAPSRHSSAPAFTFAPDTPGEDKGGGLPNSALISSNATAAQPPPLPSPGVPGAGKVEKNRKAARATNEPDLFSFLQSPPDAAPQPEIPAATIPIPSSSLEFIEAPDIRSEVDAAARWIGDRVAAGMRYRDIAVLMRSQEEYRQAIESSFQEHRIPFFIDRRRTAAHHPLLRFIRSALSIALENWPHEAVMSLLKSDLAGLTADESDSLENYVLLHGIHHSVWTSVASWTGRRSLRDESQEPPTDESPVPTEAERIDLLRRRLVDRVAPFCQAVNSSRLTVRQAATAIFQLLETFSVRSQLTRWMDRAAEQRQLEERAEHERVWDELVNLFQDWVDLLGDESIELADFHAILDAALERFDLALTPPTMDQVIIGPIDRTRPPAIKACIVLGLAEGQFPRMGSEGSIFSDSDRWALRRRKIDLDPDTQRRLFDEIFLGYLAFTRASQRLCVTRNTDGPSPAPSPLWLHLHKRLPGAVVQQIPREQQMTADLISTPRQLIVSLMRWVRAGGEDSDSWPALYRWLSQHRPSAQNTDPVDLLRYHAWKALTPPAAAPRGLESVKALFAPPLQGSVARWESFRACPFQHFARYGLNLTQRPIREVGPADLSRVYHNVLDRLLRQLLQDRTDWLSLEPAKAANLIATFTQQMGQQLRGELMLSTARNRFLLDQIERTLQAVVASQRAHRQHGDFRPAFAEVRFGQGKPGENRAAPLPPLRLQTPKKNQLLITGRIDRIDSLSSGASVAIDYRSWAGGLNAAEVYHGLSLLLLTQLLLLESSGLEFNGKRLTPAAALTVQLLRRIESADPTLAPGPTEVCFHLQPKPRGIINASFVDRFDKALETGWSKTISVHRNKDQTLSSQSADIATPQQLQTLLRHVEKRIGELADEALAGEISVRPYRLARRTPCARCEFRDLCRFEPRPGSYADLLPIKREELFTILANDSSPTTTAITEGGSP